MRVVKFDEQRDKGGEIMEILECKLLVKDSPAESVSVEHPTIIEHPMTPDIEFGHHTSAHEKRNPNHYKHFTRNVRLYSAGQPTSRITKIHPPLIIEFDGQPVI